MPIVDCIATHHQAILFIILPLFFIAVFLALKLKPKPMANLELLDTLGIESDSMEFVTQYPSLGIKIQANGEIQKPLSLQKWSVDFIGNFVCEIKATGFTGTSFKIELNLAKAEIKANESDVYLYLITHNIVRPNENLTRYKYKF